MKDKFGDIRRTYYELKDLLDNISDSPGLDVAQTRTHLECGELKLTLDDLAYFYMAIYQPVPADTVAKFDELATEMNMKSGYPWPGVRLLLGLTGEVDENA